MAKIILNNKKFNIDDTIIASINEGLKNHLLTTMAGEGATITLDGVTYNVDSTKLSVATNDFISHLNTISGDGAKVVIGGVEYSVDSAKVEGAIASLEAGFGELEAGDSDNVVGTWVFNDWLSVNGNMDTYFNFTGYDADGNQHQFNNMYIEAILNDNGDVGDFLVNYYNEDGDGFLVCDTTDAMWINSMSKTITITEQPSDPEFIAWLKANATKVGNYTPDEPTPDDSVVGTWVFNDVLECPPVEVEEPKEYQVKFTAKDNDGITRQLDTVYIFRYAEDGWALCYYNYASDINLEDVYDGAWNGENYPIITITEEPTDPEFITWLKANATKVEIEYIPEGGVYKTGYVYNEDEGYWDDSNVVTLTAGDAFPVTIARGDIYSYGDYEYCYGYAYCGGCEEWSNICGDDMETDGWAVRCVNDVAIPDSILDNINGKAITNLYDTFRGCSALTIVPKIPSSVMELKGTFAGCDNLINVIIHNNITVISRDTFAFCYKLTSVEIPDSVTSIGDYAFCDCSSLTSIAIPDSVTSIGASAFDGCSSLQYNEYDNAYYLGNEKNPYMILIKGKNENIANCEIHNLTKFIHSSAFKDCNSLTSIAIPDSVTSIGYWAFSGCKSLTSIEIPDSVTSIGNYAFRGCSALTSINFNDTMTQWNTITKGSNWNYNVPATYVQCSDGQVAL